MRAPGPRRSAESDRKNVLFLMVGEEVPVHGADEDERDHEQQQLPVQHLVQAAPPQEQQFGEPRAAGRRHLVLVADRHGAAAAAAAADGWCCGGPGTGKTSSRPRAPSRTAFARAGRPAGGSRPPTAVRATDPRVRVQAPGARVADGSIACSGVIVRPCAVRTG